MRTLEELIKDARDAIYDHAFLLSYFYEDDDFTDRWADWLFAISEEMKKELEVRGSN